MNKTDKNAFLMELAPAFAAYPQLNTTERKLPGTISVSRKLKGDGVISSVLRLQEVKSSMVVELLEVSPYVGSRDGTRTLGPGPRTWFLATTTCPPLRTGPLLPTSQPLLRQIPIPFPGCPLCTGSVPVNTSLGPPAA